MPSIAPALPYAALANFSSDTTRVPTITRTDANIRIIIIAKSKNSDKSHAESTLEKHVLFSHAMKAYSYMFYTAGWSKDTE